MRTHSRANRGLPPARSTSSRAASGGRAPGSARCSSSSSTAARSSGPRSMCSATAARPARAPLEQLRARRHDDQQPGIWRRLDEALDEVEQRRVGVVQVLQHEHGRPAPGHGLQEQAPRRHGLLAARGAAGAGQARAAAPGGGAPRPRPCRAGRRRRRRRRACGPRRRLVRRQDAGLLRDDLAQGAEGRAIAVGRDAAAPPGRQPRRLGRDAPQLGDQPALADAGLAGDHEQARASLCALLERRGQARPLRGPAQERQLVADVLRQQRARREGAPAGARAAPCPWRARARRARTRSRRGWRGTSARRPGSRRARPRPPAARRC